MADHNDLLSVNVTLEPSAGAAASFTTPLFLSDEAAGTDLGGDRVRSYSSNAAVQADTTLSAVCKARLSKAFSQTSRPATIKVGRVDTGGGEGYDDALAAVLAADDDFFGIAIESRTAQDIEDVATANEALDRKRIFVYQTAEADALTAGHPSALADTEGLVWTSGIYHDEATVYADAAWLAIALSANPDTQSGTWLRALNGIAPLTAPLTATQLGHLRDNQINVALPFGNASAYVAYAVSQEGRPVDQLVTTGWYIQRVRERLAALRLQASARGDKITVDAVGQALVYSAANQYLKLGESLDSPHFQPGQTRATLPAITDGDRTARQIRVAVDAAFATDMLLADVSGNFSTTLVYETE